MKDCPTVLKAFGLLGTGFIILVIGAISLTVRGQNSTNSTVVTVDRIQGVNPSEMFVEDEFIVVLKRGVRSGFRVGRGPSNKPSVNVASLQQLIGRHSVGRFKRQFPGSKTQPSGSTLPDLSGHYKVRIPRGGNLEAAFADFAGDPNVDHVEKIGIHPLFMTPNDSFYADQWNLRSPNGIDADLGWDTKAGSSNVVVAVLDTGVRYNHADLKGNIWVNPREIPNNGIDDDGNGFIDDVVGYDFMEDASGAALYTCCDSDCSIADNDPSDHNGHGTHLAGIVAATTNNGFGVAGIAGGYSDGTLQSTANGIKIMPLRIGWDGSFLGLACGIGLIRMDYAAEALHYVALQKASGVNIAAVNCSWGSSDSGGLGAAVDEVLANDVMIVHAAGNSSSSTADFLGTKPGVMNVAATDQNGNGASFTNYGDWVSLSAPGVDITSLWVGPDPNTEYFATASGTSMSAPHAAGVAALLESMNPALTGPQKFALMVSNTKPYVKDGRNLGSGILNANLALGALGPAPPDFILTASPSARTVAVGTATSVNVTVNPLAGFNGIVSFTASGLPAGANSDFSPLFVLGSGSSTMTVTTAITTPPGNYPITVTATSGSLRHFVTVTLVVFVPGAAAFVKTDTGTQGTWKGVYGGQGVAIANDVTSYPAYAQVTLSNQSNFTWTGSTTDVRALQKGANTDRIASTWYSPTRFDIDINLIDGDWHQVGLYCLDWGTNNERTQTIDVLDAIGGGVLDTRSVSAFSNGQYLIWNLKGHVNIRATRTGAYNAVVSGIFFDLPAPPDFNLLTTPNSQSVAVGGVVSYNLTVTSSAGFNGQ